MPPGPRPISVSMDAVVPAVASDEVSTLKARIRELEGQYAAEIERRHRAEQALANTQFELVDARRRASELERSSTDAAAEAVPTPLAATGTDSSTPAPTPLSGEASVEVSPEMISTLVYRFSRLRDELGAEVRDAPSGTGSPLDGSDGGHAGAEDPPAAVQDSLRSRLSSAANARRSVGLVEHRDPTGPAG